ncbi:hypothetical protein M8J75_002000 [Diaphorina citri]|nr:hypothetical protein M8J75_002000 [Diaphorina citri]
MNNIRLHCAALKTIGGKCVLSWSNKYQCLYILFQYSTISFYLICHAWSTFTRAIRYLPEFIQTFFEDVTTNMIVFEIICFNFKFENIMELANLMENAFCSVNSKVTRKVQLKSKKLLLLIFLGISFSVIGLVMQTMVPLTAKELEIQTDVYRTKHPERILMSNVRVPLIDETESWYYEAIMVMEIYLGLAYIVGVTLVVTLIPNVVIFMEGQYTILCEHVLNLGTQLRDIHGHRFFYTNLEKSEIECLFSILEDRKKRPFKPARVKMIEQKYEQLYLRQIICFHQKLLLFQEKVQIFFSSVVLPLIIFNNVGISLCIYQLTARTTALSDVRMFKFFIEFLTMIAQFYVLNHFSETVMEICIEKVVDNERV